MGSWRVLVMGWGTILVACLAVGTETSLPAVVPPLAAAAFVLIGAAIASDYFGLQRRSTPWRGRTAEARRLLDSIGRAGAREPVVAWVRAVQAEREGHAAQAEAIAAAAARVWAEPGVRRDLMLVRARLLARTGRGDVARCVLG